MYPEYIATFIHWHLEHLEMRPSPSAGYYTFTNSIQRVVSLPRLLYRGIHKDKPTTYSDIPFDEPLSDLLN